MKTDHVARSIAPIQIWPQAPSNKAMPTLLARLESVRERVAGGKWRETYLSAFDETSDATVVACVRSAASYIPRVSRTIVRARRSFIISSVTPQGQAPTTHHKRCAHAPVSSDAHIFN